MRQPKGVMLLPLESESYRRHIAHHTFLARVNAPDTTPDDRLPLTREVEARVRALLQHTLIPTRYRVLRWEETTPVNRVTVRYRELDGVFKTPDGTAVLVEVKASASKSSLANGMRQLRSAVEILRVVNPSACGLLVVANLGAFVEGFGEAATLPVSDYFVNREIGAIEWPPALPSGALAGIVASVIPEDVASGWLDEAEIAVAA